MTSVVSELIELLSLERLEDNLFRGQSRDIGTKYVFGGQVLGQALSAAQATMDATSRAARIRCTPISCAPATSSAPIVYDVDRTRDGGSFSVRRVTAIQHGQPIFFLAASFQKDEAGGEHQLSMPEVPQARGHRAGAGAVAGTAGAAADRRCSAGCRGRGRSSSATSIRATNSIRRSARRTSRSGSG